MWRSVPEPRLEQDRWDLGSLVTPNSVWDRPVVRSFQLRELVAVHITDQEPRNGYLYPHSYVPVVIDGNNWFFPRETLHFALNGAVGTHSGGSCNQIVYSWEKRKYAYCIPLSDLEGQIVSLFTHDTVVLGPVKLPSSTRVITDQSNGKISQTIGEMGCPVFELHGAKPFDAAILSGAAVNVNHARNFEAVRRKIGAHGQYVDARKTNILLLDDLLREVFHHAAERNAMAFSPHRITSELNNRMHTLGLRFAEHEKMALGISRLTEGVDRYCCYLRAYSELEALWNPLRMSQMVTAKMHNEYTRELSSVRKLLRWDHRQDGAQR